MTTHYRNYKDKDIKVVQGLLYELGYPLSEPELQKNIYEIIKQRGVILVAEDGGEVVGSVCVVIDARLAEGVYAEIVSLVVSQPARGKGIGKNLVKEAELWATQKVGKMRVRANEIRSSAHAFYITQGYSQSKTQKIFIKEL